MRCCQQDKRVHGNQKSRPELRTAFLLWGDCSACECVFYIYIGATFDNDCADQLGFYNIAFGFIRFFPLSSDETI